MSFHFEQSPVTRPGPLSRLDAQRLQATLDRLNRPTIAAAPLQMLDGATGRFVTFGGESFGVFLARITNSGYTTGEPRKYEFVEQSLSFTAVPALSDKEGGITGTIADDTWAREIDDVAVDDDTVVVMFKWEDGRYFFVGGKTTTQTRVQSVSCSAGILAVITKTETFINGRLTEVE